MLALLLGAPGPGAAEALPKVASTNLCADLLLLRLGAPEQIVSVSAQAQDPAVSPVAERARRYPPNRGSVEELLYLSPDLALTYLGWGMRSHAELLAERGIEVVTLPYPSDLDDALAMTRDIAEAIGRARQGRRAAADAERRIAALRAGERPLRALYLRPNGGTAGSGTYVDAMLDLLGVRNLAADAGLQGWGNLPLERLILEPPDLFLLGYFDRAQPRSQARYARHPLLRALLAETPSVRVPSNTGWGCGGLELIDAAERIAAGIDALAAARPAASGSAP